jgi:hypothetical protein
MLLVQKVTTALGLVLILLIAGIVSVSAQTKAVVDNSSTIESVAAQTNPTDAELQKYLEAHPDKFRVERQFTFRQVYLDPQRHGINLNRDAAQLLIQLQQHLRFW